MVTIRNIIKQSEKPPLYEKGTAVMWTDPYIAENLLDVHLDPDVDLASRRPGAINGTINWMLDITGQGSMDMLDLGCGPGLYAGKLAQKGHRVTGIDFSRTSIQYARQRAEQEGLTIDYRHLDYLTLSENETYDLVFMIFADFGVLLPEEQKQLLSIIHNALKPGGWFVFDVLRDRSIAHYVEPNRWEASRAGFWRDGPHLVLSDSFLYEIRKVVLYQHCIVEEQTCETYRFWTHFFSEEQLRAMLVQSGFESFRFFDDVLPGPGKSGLNDVLFCVTKKG